MFYPQPKVVCRRPLQVPEGGHEWLVLSTYERSDITHIRCEFTVSHWYSSECNAHSTMNAVLRTILTNLYVMT